MGGMRRGGRVGLNKDVRKAVRVANGLGWWWSCTRVTIWVVSGARPQVSNQTDGVRQP